MSGPRNRKDNSKYLSVFLQKYPLFPSIAMLRGEEARLFAKLDLEEPVLDLGCGNGFFTEITLGGAHSGLDRDLRQVKRARESRVYRFPVVGDICRLPYKEASFSTVFSNCVLEHVEKQEDAFLEIFRVLKPGGTCVITVPTEKFDEWFYLSWLLRKFGLHGLAKKQNDRYNKFQFQYHVYSVKEWSARLASAGLETESYQLYASQAFLFLFSAIDDIQHILGRLLVQKADSSEGCATSISERFSGRPLGKFFAQLFRPFLLPFSDRVCGNNAEGAAVLVLARKKRP